MLTMGQTVDKVDGHSDKRKRVEVKKYVKSNRSPAPRERDQLMLDLLSRKDLKGLETKSRQSKSPTRLPEPKQERFESGETGINPSMTRVPQSPFIGMSPGRPLTRSPAKKKLLYNERNNQTTIRKSAFLKLNVNSNRTYSKIEDSQTQKTQLARKPIRRFNAHINQETSQNLVNQNHAMPSSTNRIRTLSSNSICIGTTHTKKLNAAMDGNTFNKFIKQHRNHLHKQIAKQSPINHSPTKGHFSTIDYNSIDKRVVVSNKSGALLNPPSSRPLVQPTIVSTTQVWKGSTREHLPEACEFELLSNVFGSKTQFFKTEFYNPMPIEVKRKLGLVQSPLSKTRRSVSQARKAIERNF